MDVVIELKSSVVSDEQEDMSLNVLGRMLWQEDCCHLSFEILDEDGTPILTQVKTEGDFVIVEQKGSRSSRLMIREGERIASEYATPYGSLRIGVTGLSVANELTPEGGTLTLTYEVDVNAASVSTNTIEILVRRTSSDE
ncbi:MAG: DUF1934 domain-containing protein [Clostridia bacterium]|nr:DUF1934 domain-containing protein [Clostridia bacterium]